MTTLAQVNVRSNLDNAIQNIQRVYFSPNGIKDQDPSKNILVESENGVLKVHGKVIIDKPESNNQVRKNTPDTILIVGSKNIVDGTGNIFL